MTCLLATDDKNHALSTTCTLQHEHKHFYISKTSRCVKATFVLSVTVELLISGISVFSVEFVYINLQFLVEVV